MALAALRGVSAPQLDRAIFVAQSFLSVCHSADALNWLRLGLIAQGQLKPGFCPATPVAYRTLPDMSLNLLVEEAQRTNQVFLGV